MKLTDPKRASDKPPLYFRRTLAGLIAADDATADALRKVKQGAVVRGEIVQPRNIQFHRRFFGMLNVVWQACGDWPTIENLLTELKYRVGHVDEQRIIDRESGEVLATITTPRSISFASMDDAEFHAFFDRCVNVICTEMIPGLDDAVLREEVLRAGG